MYIVQSPEERRKKRLAWIKEQRKAQAEDRKKLSAIVSTFTALLVFLAVVILTLYYSTPFATGVTFFVGGISLFIAWTTPFLISTVFNIVAATCVQLVFNLIKTTGNVFQSYANGECKSSLSLFKVIIMSSDDDEAPPRCSQLGTNIYEGVDSASSNFGFDLIGWVFIELLICIGLFSFLFFGIWFFCQKKYGYWDWPDKLADKIRK